MQGVEKSNKITEKFCCKGDKHVVVVAVVVVAVEVVVVVVVG